MQIKDILGFPVYGSFLNVFGADLYLPGAPIEPPDMISLGLSETSAVFYGDPSPNEAVINFNESARQLSAAKSCWVDVSIWAQIDELSVTSKFLGLSVGARYGPAAFVQGLARLRWQGELAAGTIISPTIVVDAAANLLDGALVITAAPLPGA
jgi:hypothetical protein